MCGIVGYVGHRPAADILIQGLRRLEYRGYDSAGIALLSDQHIEIKKSEGRLENTVNLLKGMLENYQRSTCGIGHTRWATHGKPNTTNAHPHKTGHVVLVHNGIIENYLEIKREILEKGYIPNSETDSELFGFLVLDEMEKGLSLVEAIRKSFSRLQGQCSVVVMSEREPGVVVGVRNGSPLVAVLDSEGNAIVASDAQPLLQYSHEVYFLDHGDLVVGTRNSLKFYDLASGMPVQRKTTLLDWTLDKLDKGRFSHYMLKEIHEQPASLIDTLNGGLLNGSSTTPFSFSNVHAARILEQAEELILIACGTSWHAALLGKHWIERWAKIPVSVELASEFRYREPSIREKTVVIGVSQSGETADTLAVLREMKRKGIPTIGISNVRGSSIQRESDAVLYTSAGPEIGVAATKSFMCQLLMMALMAGNLATSKSSQAMDKLNKFNEALFSLPTLLALGLDERSEMYAQIRRAARASLESKGFFFIGRGHSFPIALEGALKLKEIAYVHAEGYAAGELKHGPIAMIDRDMTVVVLAPRDSWRDKTVSNLEEVKARGAKIVGIGDLDDQDLESLCDHWIALPTETKNLPNDLLPFILSPVVQLFSYEIAVHKGTDVDKPRNLAKSVTVE
jgi:glutamine---fructose-6-phosphate transaminase (isomerizing)